MTQHRSSWVMRCLVAVIASLLAVLVNLFLRRVIVPGTFVPGTLVTLQTAVLLSAWYGGMGPAALSIALCAASQVVLFEPPPGPSGSQLLVLRMLVSIVSGVVLSALVATVRRAQQRTADAMQRYRSLVDGVKDFAIFMLDAEGRVASWNNGAECIFGYRAEEIIGRRVGCLWTDAAAAGTFQEHLQQARVYGRQEIQGQGLRKDGSRFWGNALFTALRDEQRKLRGFSAIIRDVTERYEAERALRAANAKLEARVALVAINARLAAEITERARTEAALRESEERFVSAFQYAPTGMVLVKLDGHPFRVNRACVDMLGYTEEELANTTVFAVTHPDDIEANKQLLRQLLTGEIPSYSLEKRFIHKRGHVVWASVSVSLVRDREGQPLHIVSQVQDITERRRAVAALSEERNFVSALLDTVGANVVVLDTDGRIVRFNRAAEQLTGYSFEEAYGRHFWDLLTDPSEATRAQALFARQLIGKWPTEYEATWEARDGRRLTLACSTGFLRRRGTPEYLVATSVDITARKQAEQEARQREAELAHVLRVTTIGEMASGLAHEINQPLSAIVNYAKGCAHRLRAGTDVTPELLRALDQIAGESLRAAEIIRRLRQFVRKEPPRRETVDLNSMVTQVAHLVAAEARERGVALQLQLALQLALVRVDAIQIEQVLVNLVRNGFEAMQSISDTRRELTISTGMASAGAVQVAVLDTGEGLPDTIAEKVFEPFFTTKPTGLGMGLSISRSIIAAHGGQLWAMPAAERGAIFNFTLPICVMTGYAHEH